MTEEKNVFKKIEEADKGEKVQDMALPVQETGEVDYNKMSEDAVGDEVKYERESLDGKKVKILKAQLLYADTSGEPLLTLKNKAQYYKTEFKIVFDAKNKDDAQHREYIPGIVQYVQKDGSLSLHKFWYQGSGTEAAALWEIVAEHKGIKPEDLSPREFLGFLNSGVTAIMEYRDNGCKGEYKATKNYIKGFVKE